MNITTVLFDLDGTLLPMDQEEFTKEYFRQVAAKLTPHGYEPQTLIGTIWSGTLAMIKNTGSCNNESVFWKTFTKTYGQESIKDKPKFDEFYHTDFQRLKDICGFNPKAREVIQRLKETGFRVVLATNPIFPSIATKSRIRWAGLQPEDFELYTTYENSRYCKPNPAYYIDILNSLKLTPEECLMVGNDVDDDMVVQQLGIKVFLLTDCLINKGGTDISIYPHGDFTQLLQFMNVI